MTSLQETTLKTIYDAECAALYRYREGWYYVIPDPFHVCKIKAVVVKALIRQHTGDWDQLMVAIVEADARKAGMEVK